LRRQSVEEICGSRPPASEDVSPEIQERPLLSAKVAVVRSAKKVVAVARGQRRRGMSAVESRSQTSASKTEETFCVLYSFETVVVICSLRAVSKSPIYPIDHVELKSNKYYKRKKPAEVVMILTCVGVVTVWNVGWDTGLPPGQFPYNPVKSATIAFVEVPCPLNRLMQ
jgi:hypothetical protein